MKLRSQTWSTCGVVVAAVLASACGSDGVEPLLTCGPGPVFQSTIESCELVVDGNGGPTAARLRTIEAENQTLSHSYELTSDGGVYVFAHDGLTTAVARLGPSGELSWSRSLVLGAAVPDDAASAQIEASATGPEGLDVVVQRRSEFGEPTQYAATTLIHLENTGECGSPVVLAFGGEYQGNVGNLVREQDRLVLTGIQTASWDTRGFVQRRSLAGELVVETEIEESDYNHVLSTSIQVGGPERYVVHYSGTASNGISGFYSGGQLFDESLTSVGPSMGKYTSDAFGRLYTSSNNATAGDPLTEPPEEPQPPTLYRVTRSQTPDASAGETLELEVPQPQCGWPSLTLFDESLLVLICSPPDSPTLLLGYDGSGPPSWTANVACPDADVSWSTARFTEDRRLWLSATPGDDKHILSIEL
jgi:hypothetical protein